MREFGDSEEVRLLRAKASVNLIYDYGNTGELAEARALFDAMREFGDSEEVRLLRAKASVNLINAYGNTGDLAEARALFDAMREFGDSEEVQLRRAKASVNLIFAYGKAGDLAEARATFDASTGQLGSLLSSVVHDNSNVSDLDWMIRIFIVFAALGRAEESLRLIECSDDAKYFEPLVAGLRLYLGEKVWVAQEIHEVAEDIKRKIDAANARIS
jgi:pentatricopeptide repeat protein